MLKILAVLMMTGIVNLIAVGCNSIQLPKQITPSILSKTFPFSLTTPLPIFTPAGKYEIEETGATDIGHGVYGEIGGRKYLFLEINTQGSNPLAAPQLLILDVQNPSQPIKIASLKATDNTRWLWNSALSGTTLYVNADNFLWLIDVSNPAAPKELSKLNNIQPINLAVSGNHAYINDNNQRISVADVSDPVHPRFIGDLALSSSSGIGLNIIGHYLLAKTIETLYVIDISSPDSLKIINNFSFGADTISNGPPTPEAKPTYILGQAISGKYTFLVLGNGGKNRLSILDISDPTNPKQISQLDLSSQNARSPIFVSGQRVYLFSEQLNPNLKVRDRFIEMIVAVDISDPANPVSLGSCALPGSSQIFPTLYSGSSETANVVGNYLYWFLGNPPNHPVIEIINLSASETVHEP